MSRKSANTVANALASEEKKLLDELAKLEKQIYHLETSYLENTAQIGNLVRGWNEFLSSKPSRNDKSSPMQKKKLFSNEDRIFTLSSSTSKNIEFEPSQKKKSRPKDHEDDHMISPQKKKQKKS